MARHDIPYTAEQIDNAIGYAYGKYADEVEAAIKAKFTLTQSGDNVTRYADTDTTKTLTVTVTCKYDGTNVQPTNHATLISGGWTSSATGEYTKTLTAASGSIAAQAFTYTKDGVNISKSSTARSISEVYPAYYGWASDKNISSVIWNTATRRTSALSGDVTLTNGTNAAAYLFILTKSASATAKQLGANVLDAALTGQSFTSPQNNDITMGGYRLYLSSGSFAAGAAPTFTMNIPLS